MHNVSYSLKNRLHIGKVHLDIKEAAEEVDVDILKNVVAKIIA